VGCAVDLHVQDNQIVKVTSPMDSTVTDGHLCIKGRFGFEFTNAPREPGATAAARPPALQQPERDDSPPEVSLGD
jgi:anaerobic selenocysteine-containing dehydrogenase